MVEIHAGNIKLIADPDDGMTVTSLLYKGMETIEADEERKRAGSTYGIPILFPTPNRVSGDAYTFNGKTVQGVMHGNLRHSVFTIADKELGKVKAVLPFDALGECFPYEGEFALVLSIADDSVIWDISVANKGNEMLSFGLALHPFFCKREGMVFSSTIEYEMEAGSDKIPTGRWWRTDFGMEKRADGIDTDTVFFSDSSIRSVLSSPDYSITIAGSPDFNHAVVFTSPERSFICVEPQTCSTDAHNMYSKGFVKESGLIIVPPHSSHDLWVKMAFGS